MDTVAAHVNALRIEALAGKQEAKSLQLMMTEALTILSSSASMPIKRKALSKLFDGVYSALSFCAFPTRSH